MPEYQNDSNENVICKKSDGGVVIVEPGKSLKTYYYSDDSRLTKISAEPLWDPVAMPPTDINLAVDGLEGGAYEPDGGFAGVMIPVPLDAASIYILRTLYL